MSNLKDLLINISEEKQNKILPENLKSGVTVFDVEGTFTADGTANSNKILQGYTAYVNGEKVTGTIQTNGSVIVQPTQEDQVLTEGYYYRVNVPAVDITTLYEYQACLELSEQILAEPEVFPYAFVQYITFPGTSNAPGGNYFDLGVPLWSYENWKAEVTMSMSQFYQFQHIFSVADDDLTKETWADQNGIYYMRYANSNTNKQTIGQLILNQVHTLTHDYEYDTCYSYIDGELKNTTAFGTMRNSNNLRFGRRQYSYFLGNLYSIKLYKDDELIRHFVPVIVKETEEATLYDLVTQTLATNLGTKTCVAGPLVETEVE